MKIRSGRSRSFISRYSSVDVSPFRSASSITIWVGRTRPASFLVQRRYAWRGYQIDAPAATEPSRITLSAYDGDEVVATISVGFGSGEHLCVFRRNVTGVSDG